jgi:hypothetical protein
MMNSTAALQVNLQAGPRGKWPARVALAHRGQARIPRQRRIRHAGPHPLTPPATTTYPAHQIGVLSAGPDNHFARIIIPVQSGTYRHLRNRVTRLTRGIGSEVRSGFQAARDELDPAGRRALELAYESLAGGGLAVGR